jgi:hypothetical protein
MPTYTRTGRPARSGQGRYARSTSTPRRLSSTPRLRRRKPPEPSGFKKAVSALLPAAAAKQATPRSKKGKAGGLALVAAAAGMAFKNRGRLSQLRRKDTGVAPAGTPGGNASKPPATPVV